MSTEQNQPAFPSPPIPTATDERDNQRGGMTLRDYFAAKAMQTLIHDWCEGDPKHAADTALRAYTFADAMLAERNKSHEH